MPIPNLKKQIFGDFNEQLNKARKKMNNEIRLKCLEISEKKKQQQKI